MVAQVKKKDIRHSDIELNTALDIKHNTETSIKTGNVTVDWGVANVILIFKKGDKVEPGNHRPISLTAIKCKIMESIVRGTLEEYPYTAWAS